MVPASYFSVTANISAPLDMKYSYSSELIDFPGWKIVENKFSRENTEYQYLQTIKKETPIPYKKITSKESLQSLKNQISSKIYNYYPKSESYETSSFTRTWIRKLAKILDYHYGPGSGTKILSNGVKVKKSRINTQLEILDVKDNHSIGVFKYDTGQINLNIQGASLLTPFSDLTSKIVFNGKKITGTTLFRPGVLEYNNDLIPRNNVIILNETKENVIGMGHLIIGSNVIRNTKTGRVAIIYDRI